MKVSNFNSGIACMNWLNYLYTYCGAGPLMGTDPEPVVERAFLYKIIGLMSDYYAEFQLKGSTGLDLSVQYIAKEFALENPLKGTSVAPEGELFQRFARELFLRNPELINMAHVYLESDSSKGKIKGSSVFINMTGEIGEELLPLILEIEGKSNCLEAILKLNLQCREHAVPWLYGFMRTREKKPVRLTLYVLEESFNGLRATLNSLGLNAFVHSVYEDLQNICAPNLFNFAVDLDILDDGSLGETIGIQLAPKTQSIYKQKNFLASGEYLAFVKSLKEKGLADDRIDLLSACVWEQLAPDTEQEPYHMYSFISHFKLRWQEQKLLPAKVYLQMRSLEQQQSINETIRV